ncbi:MAG TPA: (Fe-S)-binding protein [Chryseolinea sp.]|nr:(Fe-S)-binding protein [Chryseolinea sp.]
MIQQIAFAGVVAGTTYLVARRVAFIRRNINLGKPKAVSASSDRFKNMILVAFGQKKMFKRPIPAILHLFIYVGFLVINIEVLEFVIDGLAGTHRIFSSLPFYGLMMNLFEFLAVSVLLACLIMLFRRNVLKITRLSMPELNGWPRLDANIILITEVALMCAILTMNASDQLLQRTNPHYIQTGRLFFSSFLIPVFDGQSGSALVAIERVAWWFHILGILAFAVYITYSKHLHIALAFPNTYFANVTPKGHMENMPVVTNEVKIMLGLTTADSAVPPAEPGRFGAKDVGDLNRNNLLAAYSCTECGRCTAECPANLTGKKLSPRKIMMDTRDRMEEVGRSLDTGGAGLSDGKPLLDHYITREEINACTSCSACVEACPVMINPMEIILELRRYVAMEESGAPASWNAMFQNIETSFAPWKFPSGDRFNWANELKK